MSSELPRSIGKDRIRDLIPHAGAMCLLDRVMDWSDTTIVCISRSHRAPENPLRRDGRLGGLHVFEYAAQAAAVHGALRTGARDAGPRVFAALRNAHLAIAYLDDIGSPLEIRAERLLIDGDNAIYRASIRAGDRPVAEARLSLMIARHFTP